MSLRDLPKIRALAGRRWSLRDTAINHWDAGYHAASDDENAIDIYDAIGEDFWGDGVSLKTVQSQIKSMSGDITVNINSPGGDFFDGVGIYNALREYDGKVTTRVIGVAASAASVIAMAGDDIQIAQTGFMMIHKAWGVTVGNADDNRETADTLDRFDASMANLYATHMGLKKDEVLALMAKDTWFDGEEAVEAGLASGYLPSDEISKDEDSGETAASTRSDLLFDNAMRAAYPDMSRSERRALRKDMKAGTSSATGTATPGAGEFTEALMDFANSIKL